MTPAQAIAQADTVGFCKIKHKTFLWKTCEASAAIKMEVKTPYMLITDGNWSVPHGVRNAADQKLHKACQ